jgi:hypothetical protein
MIFIFCLGDNRIKGSKIANIIDIDFRFLYVCSTLNLNYYYEKTIHPNSITGTFFNKLIF